MYREGKQVVEAQDFAEMAAACRDGDGIAWIGLYRPTREEFAAVTREFGLHELAVEDAVGAHQRAKLEYYGETLFCVLHPARYIDETETVEFGEVHVFAGPQFVITVRHGQAPELAAVRHGLGATRPAAPRPSASSPRRSSTSRACWRWRARRTCARCWRGSSAEIGRASCRERV